MIHVEFKHWKYEFLEADLQQGSPNKKGEAKTSLRKALEQAKCVQEKNIPFTEEQIICANEAFPEAALANPLADLKIWNEWRSGIRIFPYPGHYSRLSITNQPPKTNSTSSIGVIGEIMAGIIGQAIIAPEVLVRVIHQWPDFIFYPIDKIDNRYSLLEAKAFTQKLSVSRENPIGISGELLGESLLDAVQHLNFDPFVKVWYSFTGIQEIEPICRLTVQFLELDVPQERRNSRQPTVPKIVIDGLAERAIQKGLFKLLQLKNSKILSKFRNRERSKERAEAEENLCFFAEREIDNVLSELSLDLTMNLDRETIIESIKRQVNKLVIIQPSEGEDISYFQETKSEHDGSELVRTMDSYSLYKMELSVEERMEINKNWQPDLYQSTKYLEKKFSTDKTFWRCGSVAFALVYNLKNN